MGRDVKRNLEPGYRFLWISLDSRDFRFVSVLDQSVAVLIGLDRHGSSGAGGAPDDRSDILTSSVLRQRRDCTGGGADGEPFGGASDSAKGTSPFCGADGCVSLFGERGCLGLLVGEVGLGGS